MDEPPKVLLLDVMETLVRDPVWDIPGFFGVEWDALWADKHPTSWLDFEHGLIDEKTFLSTFFGDGRAYDHEGFLELFERGWAWLDGMEELLAELHGAGVPMHALSNYPCWWERIERKLNLSRFLDWTFVSCITGVRKPAADAYLGPAKALGLPPSACLFVDDRTKNTAAAEAVGMRALKFEGAATLRRQLAELGLPVSPAAR